MTTKERLHRLIDELSDQEVDDAMRYIVSRHGEEFASWLASRPEDDEPLTIDEEEAVADGRADIAAGRLTSLEDVEDELGLTGRE